MPFRLPRLRPGSVMSVRPFNEKAFPEVEELDRFAVGEGLEVYSSGAGRAFYASERGTISGRVAGHVSGGRYTVQPIRGASGGGWADLPYPAVTAWEYNANATVPIGAYVRLRREPFTGSFRFQASSC